MKWSLSVMHKYLEIRRGRLKSSYDSEHKMPYKYNTQTVDNM